LDQAARKRATASAMAALGDVEPRERGGSSTMTGENQVTGTVESGASRPDKMQRVHDDCLQAPLQHLNSSVWY
jgi:hypothetical protein